MHTKFLYKTPHLYVHWETTSNFYETFRFPLVVHNSKNTILDFKLFLWLTTIIINLFEVLSRSCQCQFSIVENERLECRLLLESQVVLNKNMFSSPVFNRLEQTMGIKVLRIYWISTAQNTKYRVHVCADVIKLFGNTGENMQFYHN